jgi:DNA-binding MarR family transcriptional regulator
VQFDNLYLLFRCAKEFGHSRIRGMGVTDTEHLICTFLLGHCASSQDDVASALKLDKTTVARALSSLEKKGFVERCVNEANRRKYILALTASGRENIADIVGVYDRWFDQVVSCLSPGEQTQFDEYCAKMLLVAEKLNEEIKNSGK